MVEKIKSEKKTTTANKSQNAVIQKNETDTGTNKKPETPAIQKTLKSGAQEAQLPVSNFPMTLEEFCTRLSQDKNQVEMIGGFYAHEKSASKESSVEKTSHHILDTEVNFKTRFDDFCTLPVMS